MQETERLLWDLGFGQDGGPTYEPHFPVPPAPSPRSLSKGGELPPFPDTT